MSMLEDLFRSGRIVDIIVLLMLLEALALMLYRRVTGRGIPLAESAANLAAGAALMLALRSALTGEPWTTTALWLGAGLLAHITDLAVRWR